MENQEILDAGMNNSSSLYLNAASRDYLKQTAKWGKLLAVISIIFSILIILIGLFFGKFMNAMTGMQEAAGAQNMPDIYSGSLGIIMAIYYAVIGLVMLYPGIRLLQFSRHTKDALDGNDNAALESGFKSLRSIFRFYGIIAIISIVFAVLGVLAMLVAFSALGALK